jgi:ABC-type transporter Mla maintaining outer membrane lipid asymmetry permease subunit MlaE
MALLLGRIASALATRRVPLRALVDQIYAMGVQSLPIVLVTASLAGVVTSQQGG